MNIKQVTITPQRAGELLKTNKNNRTPRPSHYKFLSNEMRSGNWRENGESIVIDSLGHLIDGQHRLLACIDSNTQFDTILVEGVETSVVSTIDTGSRRSLSDTLKMNGFKNSVNLAGLITSFHTMMNGSNSIGRGNSAKLSNSDGLYYANKNKDLLYTILKFLTNVHHKQVSPVWRLTELSKVYYKLNGLSEPTDELLDFFKLQIGANSIEGCAATYVYKMKARAQQQKTPLNGMWVLALVVKAWNLYITGNPPIGYLRHDINSKCPEVLKRATL